MATRHGAPFVEKLYRALAAPHSTAHEPFPCTNPSTPSTRLRIDRKSACSFSSLRYDPTGTQPVSFDGTCSHNGTTYLVYTLAIYMQMSDRTQVNQSTDKYQSKSNPALPCAQKRSHQLSRTTQKLSHATSQ